ncbi:phage repressor protein [Streptococcus iniae]|nr:phage repressor protein [Streptococcus iniae]RLU58531.1 phage repressor protein [Streptococcus iniae]RLU60523.1 phage repressor protein [Streptococcus iniae]RLU68683.1 phage repressor protein [Streptococcus iniae]RLU82674.1 phage repressor protein [Streptococcus iniae]
MNDKERMQIIADNITYYRKRKGVTQKELAKAVGVTPSTMTDYMKLRSAPSFGVIQKLADYFDIKKSDIDTTFKDSKCELKIPSSPLVNKITNKVVELNVPRKQKVLEFATNQLKEQNNKITSIKEHLYEYKVYEKLSAGTGYGYFGDGNYDTVFYDEKMDYDFASWVFGDSMEPAYLNGEVVLIKQTGFDYDGGIYAVEWDGQTYIKKVYREENGLRLVSLNKKYNDKFASFDEDPRIIGKIVGNFMPKDY